MYKGLIPRTIHMFPILFTIVAATKGGYNVEAFEGIRSNPLLGSLKF